MASDPNHKTIRPKSRNQQLVSTMIKQGFISDYSLLSPPSTSRALSSPTLFDMMSVDQAHEPKTATEAHKKLQDKITNLLSQAPFNNNVQWEVGDVRLTVAAKAGDDAASVYRVSVDVHRRVLAAKSRFFAEKLRRSGTHSVDILDCDDVDVYVEAVVLMYCGGCDELEGKLVGMDLNRILALLKISSAIMFDDAVRACLDYLDAVPWSEEEEEKVISLLNQLQQDGLRIDNVLQRVKNEQSTSSRADGIFLKLSFSVLQAKDDKARREMKSLIYRLLKEDQNKLDISKDTLYHLCHRCLSSLILCLSGASSLDESKQDRGAIMGEIAREADNMQWIVDILIDRKMGGEFVKLWADQKELAILHSKIPTMYRHEISKITAQLCVSIGKGLVLVPKDIRFALLDTWLEALYDDFSWMRRGGKAFDKKLLEEGLSHTILTLPLNQQQTVLMSWFDRFLSRGDDCPNIQKAFEIWWRRAFVKQYVNNSRLQMTVYDDIPN